MSQSLTQIFFNKYNNQKRSKAHEVNKQKERLFTREGIMAITLAESTSGMRVGPAPSPPYMVVFPLLLLLGCFLRLRHLKWHSMIPFKEFHFLSLNNVNSSVFKCWP